MKFGRFSAEISISKKSSKFEVVFNEIKKLRGIRTPYRFFIIYIKVNKNFFRSSTYYFQVNLSQILQQNFHKFQKSGVVFRFHFSKILQEQNSLHQFWAEIYF